MDNALREIAAEGRGKKQKLLHNPARAARRNARHLSKSERSDRCLTAETPHPLVVRPAHRIAHNHIFRSQAWDSLTVPACLNCHSQSCARRLCTGRRRANDSGKGNQPVCRASSSIACHFELLAKACWRFAKENGRNHDHDLILRAQYIVARRIGRKLSKRKNRRDVQLTKTCGRITLLVWTRRHARS